MAPCVGALGAPHIAVRAAGALRLTMYGAAAYGSARIGAGLTCLAHVSLGVQVQLPSIVALDGA